jgi:Kef-type K+ transport system membrane component KefB
MVEAYRFMKLPPTFEVSLLVLVFGVLLLTYTLLTVGLTKWHVPAVIGGIVLGIVAREISGNFPSLMAERGDGILEFLGTVGIVCLLFRVGLEADVACLQRQFKGAAFLWVANVSVSAFAGFAAAWWWLDFDFLTSLIIAVALSATSVGIPVEVWRTSGKLKSAGGQRFLEVAELDDISAVLLMALLFAVVPVIAGPHAENVWPVLGTTMIWFTLKLIGFFAFCAFFAKYVEQPVTDFCQKAHPIIAVAGIGFMIAALAGMLGFSVAVGAFFAGLAYSRDPRAIKIDAQFESLYEFFTPFFFIYLGFQVPAHLLGQGLAVGGVLLFVAVLGKLVGTVLPARLSASWRDSFAFGVSMVPRAEIALLIVAAAGSMGVYRLPETVFPGMIFVTLATSLGVPFVLERLLVDNSQSPHVPAP